MGPHASLSNRGLILLLLLGIGCRCSGNDGGRGGGGGAVSTGGVAGTGGSAPQSGGAGGSAGGATFGAGGKATGTGGGGAGGLSSPAGTGGSDSGGRVGTGGSGSSSGCGLLPDSRVSMYHPTAASSTAADSLSGYINDGSTSTVWMATSSDSKAWCWVALEQSYNIDAIELTFPNKGNYRYTIDISNDSSTWKTVVDQSQTTSTDQTRCATGNLGSGVQWVRVSFVGLPSGQPAGLAEISVGGTLVE